MEESELGARVIELEAKLAFHEDLLQSLNDVVGRLSADLERAMRQVGEVARRLDALQAGDMPEGDAEQPPPHY